MANAIEAFAFQTVDAASIARDMPDRDHDVINVREYGAVGDGVTDDYAALMAAYNHDTYTLTAVSVANPATNGAVVFAPPIPPILLQLSFAVVDLTNPSAIVGGKSAGAYPATNAITILNQTGLSGVQPGDQIQFTLVNRGTIFFPAGNYFTSQSLDMSGANDTVVLLGVGAASQITGNFADYVIRRQTTDTDGSGGGHDIQKLAVVNTNPAGGGIRWGRCSQLIIRDCFVTANLGINTASSDTVAGVSSIGGSIENCVLSPGANPINSIGIMSVTAGPIRNCTMTGFATGAMTWGQEGGQSFQGCQFINCNMGYAPGTSPVGANGTSGTTLYGCRFLNCVTAVGFGNGGTSLYGCVIESTNATVFGSTPQYGVTGNSVIAGSYRGVYVTGQFSQAGIDLSQYTQAGSFNTFMKSVTVNNTGAGQAWKLPSAPTTASAFSITACNVAPVYAMAALPIASSALIGSPPVVWKDGTVTITIASPPGGTINHGLCWNIEVTGITPSGYNGTFTGCLTPSSNALTYSVPSFPGSYVSGGQVQLNMTSAVALQAYQLSTVSWSSGTATVGVAGFVVLDGETNANLLIESCNIAGYNGNYSDATVVTAPVAATGSSYNSGTGVVTLNLSVAPVFRAGDTTFVWGLTGTGADLSRIEGGVQVQSIAGNVITYQVAAGLSVSSITGGNVNQNQFSYPLAINPGGSAGGVFTGSISGTALTASGLSGVITAADTVTWDTSQSSMVVASGGGLSWTMTSSTLRVNSNNNPQNNFAGPSLTVCKGYVVGTTLNVQALTGTINIGDTISWPDGSFVINGGSFPTYTFSAASLVINSLPMTTGSGAIYNSVGVIAGEDGQENAVEGDVWNVNDCSVNTWSTPALAGGSTHAKLRYNGAALTVMGI